MIRILGLGLAALGAAAAWRWWRSDENEQKEASNPKEAEIDQFQNGEIARQASQRLAQRGLVTLEDCPPNRLYGGWSCY